MAVRVGLVAAMVVVAVVLVAVGDRTRRFADVTEEDLLTLTTQTREVVDRIDGDVEITVLLRADDPERVPAASLLERYRDLDPRIDVRIIDPRDSPGEVERLGVDEVFAGVAVRHDGDVEIGPGATESDITSALARAVSDETVTVCATTGFGEAPLGPLAPDGLGTAVQILRDDGMEVEEINLAADPTVPERCGVVVVANPTGTPTDEAMTALVDWVTDDGKMMVLADPNSAVDLSPLLDTHAVEITQGLVFEADPDAVIGGDVAAPLVRTYSSASPVTRRLPPTYFPGVQRVARDEAVEDPEASGLTVSVLAQTTAVSYLETDPVASEFDPDQDVAGPVPIAVAADRSRLEEDGEGAGEIFRSRMVVVGDVDFATNTFIGEAANARLFLQAARWLALDDEVVALSPSIALDRPLRLTDSRITYARTLTMGLIPLLFLAVGATVWAARRSR